MRLTSATKSADANIKLIQITNIELPKLKEQVIEIEILSIADTLLDRSVTIQIPEAPIFTIRDVQVSPTTSSSPESPSVVDEGVIFDPRLRQRVLAENPADGGQIPDSWTNSSNVQWVKLRDGRCLRSMQVHNSRSNERTWANKPCGKDPGEQMVDNLKKALQGR